MKSSIRYINAINIMVFFAWNYATVPETDFMFNNFLVSWTSLLDGRVWTLLTSVFSHNMLLHLLLNTFVLMNFGPVIETYLGRKRFIIFYLLAGAFSSLCHAAVSAFLLHDPSLPALGASGAISAVILLFSLLYPREIIFLLGFIPLPAIVGALAFIGLDVWGLVEQSGGGGLPIGHGAHLGGAFIGICYFIFFRKKESAT
jgi:membrane associated rhomboid family serine protease